MAALGFVPRQLALPLGEAGRAHRFPETKYMGSKRALLPFILRHVSHLRFGRALDAFSGSGCVAYGLKQLNVEVHANDFLRFAFHIARATVENNGTLLDAGELRGLLRRNPRAKTFVRDTFKGLYFGEQDNEFLDHLWANIQELGGPLKRSLALSAACRAAMKKRPRGIFTFTGKKGWDGRVDLRLTMEQQFLAAAEGLNAAVFANGRRNRALCGDVFDVDPRGYDLVYIDPPYISPFSDCDYTRRYHFVEGFCTYWRGLEILEDTRTRKIRSYKTAFAGKGAATESFARLFQHFARSVLVVSYSSNGVPSREEMVGLLRSVKRNVAVHEARHRYSHGTHSHKVGENRNTVMEYLFVAQ